MAREAKIKTVLAVLGGLGDLGWFRWYSMARGAKINTVL